MRTWNPSEDRLISGMDWKQKPRPKPKPRPRPLAKPESVAKPKPHPSHFKTMDLPKIKPAINPLDTKVKEKKYDKKIQNLREKLKSIEIPEQKAFYQKQILKYAEKKLKLKLNPESVIKPAQPKPESAPKQKPKKKNKSPMPFWNKPKVVKMVAKIKKAEGGPKRGFQHNLKQMLAGYNKKHPEKPEIAPPGLLEPEDETKSQDVK